jgi:hypothetical protein
MGKGPSTGSPILLTYCLILWPRECLDPYAQEDSDETGVAQGAC